jgi:hypothetical protein
VSSLFKFCIERTAGRSGTSIASLERFLVATLAEVVSAGMGDDSTLGKVSWFEASRNDFHWATYANDALGPDELDQLVGHGALGVALAIGIDVSKVTNMAGLVHTISVGRVVRVDCKLC